MKNNIHLLNYGTECCHKLWSLVLYRIKDPLFTRLTPIGSSITDKILEMSDRGLIPHFNSMTGFPNCRRFIIKCLSDWHPIYLKYGIPKREEAAELEILPYRNGSINRWLRHQFSRLNKNVAHRNLFWSIGSNLLRSSSYQVACYQEIAPGWHRNKAYYKVWSLFKMYYEKYIWNTHRLPYVYKIVRLPEVNKPEGRPLSVPSECDRLRHRMLYHLLLIFFGPYIPTNQHGFLPGRGTLTAWSEILNKQLYNKPYIYEYDYSKFYDKIDLTKLSKMLQTIGVPSLFTDEIIECYRIGPTMGTFASHQTWSSFEEQCTKYVLDKYGLLYSSLSLSDQLMYTSECRDINPPYPYYYGVGQGSPISPLLASMCIHDVLSKHPNILAYADDGIIFGDTESDITSALETINNNIYNLKLADSPKSEYICFNGIYLKPLKFLGITYKRDLTLKYIQGTLTQHPRSGEGNFVLNDALLEMCDEVYHYESSQSPRNQSPNHRTFLNYFSSKMFGYIQSRIYNGGFDLEGFTQNFDYTYVTYSWSHLVDLELQRSPTTRDPKSEFSQILRDNLSLDIFNSSSVSCHLLARRVEIQLKRRLKAGKSRMTH
jgi:hypothetical protein